MSSPAIVPEAPQYPTTVNHYHFCLCKSKGDNGWPQSLPRHWLPWQRFVMVMMEATVAMVTRARKILNIFTIYTTFLDLRLAT